MPILARKDADTVSSITKRYVRKADNSVAEVDAVLARTDDRSIVPLSLIHI